MSVATDVVGAWLLIGAALCLWACTEGFGTIVRRNGWRALILGVVAFLVIWPWLLLGALRDRRRARR